MPAAEAGTGTSVTSGVRGAGAPALPRPASSTSASRPHPARAERLTKPVASVATPATPTADVLPEASSRTVTPTAAVGSQPVRLPAAAAVARTAPLFAATVSQPTAAALIGNPAPVAASISSIGGGLNQLLTNTANWLAQLPGGPITELIQGAVYLVRRTIFPTSVGVVTKPIMVPIYPTEINGDKNT